MDRPVWTDQCDDCGRRYPSAAKLRKHTTRMHSERVHCQFQGCNWNCSSQDVYRLRKHELDRHSRRRFIPMVTPRPHQSMPSVVNIPSLHSTTSTPLKTPPHTYVAPLRHNCRGNFRSNRPISGVCPTSRCGPCVYKDQTSATEERINLSATS
jgi:hypothetical protein